MWPAPGRDALVRRSKPNDAAEGGGHADGEIMEEFVEEEVVEYYDEEGEDVECSGEQDV